MYSTLEMHQEGIRHGAFKKKKKKKGRFLGFLKEKPNMGL